MVRNMNTARVEQHAGAEAPAAEQHIQQKFLWSDIADLDAVESPARRLQMELQQSFAASEASRWSKRRAVVFIAATSAVLWIAMIAAARALL